MPVALRLVLIVLAALIASHLVAAIVLFQPFLLALVHNAQLPHTRVANGTLLLGAPQLGPTEVDQRRRRHERPIEYLDGLSAISTGPEEGVSAFDAAARVARPHASLVQRPQLEVHRAPSEPIAAGENA